MRAKLILDEAFARRTFVSLTIMCMRSAAVGAKFALTLFIARFIDLSTLGMYGLITGISVVFPVIAGLGLIRIVSRNAVSQNLPEVTQILRRYWAIQAVVYGAIVLLALGLGIYFTPLSLMILVVSVVFLEHVNSDLFVLLNHRLQPRLANALMFIRTAGWIFPYMALAFVFPGLRDLNMLLAFWIGGGLCAMVGFGFATRHWPWLRAHSAPAAGDWLRRHVRASRVLYVNDVANVAVQYSDRYLVGLFLGLELTGVYVLFWSIGNALSNLVSTGVIQLSEPNLIGAHKRQDGTYWVVFRRLLVETVGSSVAMAIATAVLAYFAVPYLQRPLVTEWLPVLWLILLGFVLRMAYEVQGSVFYSRYNDRFTLYSGLFVIVLSTAANIVFTPLYTLYGAAAAIVASYFAGAVIRHLIIVKYCR